jgi:hypothetical protein
MHHAMRVNNADTRVSQHVSDLRTIQAVRIAHRSNSVPRGILKPVSCSRTQLSVHSTLFSTFLATGTNSSYTSVSSL